MHKGKRKPRGNFKQRKEFKENNKLTKKNFKDQNNGISDTLL